MLCKRRGQPPSVAIHSLTITFHAPLSCTKEQAQKAIEAAESFQDVSEDLLLTDGSSYCAKMSALGCTFTLESKA